MRPLRRRCGCCRPVLVCHELKYGWLATNRYGLHGACGLCLPLPRGVPPSHCPTLCVRLPICRQLRKARTSLELARGELEDGQKRLAHRESRVAELESQVGASLAVLGQTDVHIAAACVQLHRFRPWHTCLLPPRVQPQHALAFPPCPCHPCCRLRKCTPVPPSRAASWQMRLPLPRSVRLLPSSSSRRQRPSCGRQCSGMSGARLAGVLQGKVGVACWFVGEA